jgi:hypothetical protein
MHVRFSRAPVHTSSVVNTLAISFAAFLFLTLLLLIF